MKGEALEEKPLVSIVVSVYNHARYIGECLRSIAAQKIDFPIEVLVADDCSPDGTADVLRALEPELPNFFTFILREQNLGAVKNGEDLYAQATGKYLVDLEGDDFWTYSGKLQAQVDFLEDHPEYSAVYTLCTVVGADSKPNGEEYPQCPFDEYTFRDYFYSRLPGQSGTLVCRREQYVSMREEFMGMRTFDFYPGDRRNAFLFLVAGKVRCIQESWSAYRHVASGGTSYSSTVTFNDSYAVNEVQFGKTLVAYACLHGSEEALETAKKTYYRTYLKWALDKRSSLKLGDCLRELKGERHWSSYLIAPVQWYAVLGTRMLRGMPVDL